MFKTNRSGAKHKTLFLVTALLAGFAEDALAADSTAASTSDEQLGKLLGSAVETLEREGRTAAPALRELSKRRTSVHDYVLYYLGLAEAESNRELAADLLDQVVRDYPNSAVRPSAEIQRARWLIDRRQFQEAADIVDRIDAPKSDQEDLAKLHVDIAAALQTSDPAAAADHLSDARRIAPGTTVATKAHEKLVELRKSHAKFAPKGPDAIYAEARAVGRLGRFEEQTKWVDRFLIAYPKDRRRTDALLLRARSVAKSSGRVAASAWLEARSKEVSSPSIKAKLLFAAATDAWNANDNGRALELFRRVTALNTRTTEQFKAHYAIGRILESRKEFTTAALDYRKGAAATDKKTERESAWRTGWVLFKGDRPQEAAASFERAANQASDRLVREEALYWQARSLEKAGEKSKAQTIYQDLLKENPDGFYSYLAEKRSGLAAALPKTATIDSAEVQLTGPVRHGIQRARVLAAAGLHDFAVEEAERAASRASKAERRAILNELSEVGAHAKALRMGLELYHAGTITEDQLYFFLYPNAHEMLVRNEAYRYNLDPYLILSLIRQESLFDHRAVSPASARGLMQLMPATAKRLAPEAGITDAGVTQLFAPKTNVRLGTHYLAKLAKQFDYDPVLMLAAYNAGETAAERWQKQFSHLPQDEFIESISYRETRNYVKKVLRNYRNYLRLYGELRAPAASTAETSQQAAR